MADKALLARLEKERKEKEERERRERKQTGKSLAVKPAESPEANTELPEEKKPNVPTIDEFSKTAADFFSEKVWKSFEYQGLDPEKIFADLVRYGVSANRSLGEFYGDIMEILTFYARRGTNIDGAATTRSTDSGAKTIKTLKKRYKISSRLAGAKNGVTVARIVAVFPEVIAAFNILGLSRIIGDPVKHGLPEVFAFPGAPALLDASEWAAIKEPFLNYMVEFSRVINNKNPDYKAKTDQQIKEEQLGYSDAAHNSSFNQTKRAQKKAAVKSIVFGLLKTDRSTPRTYGLAAYDWLKEILDYTA